MIRFAVICTLIFGLTAPLAAKEETKPSEATKVVAIDPVKKGETKPAETKPSDPKKPDVKPGDMPKPTDDKKPSPTDKPQGKPEDDKKPSPTDKPEVKPEVDPRDLPPSPRSPVAKELLEGQSQFAESLYAALAKGEKGNLAFSPFSVSQALSLLSEGARGESLVELDAALQVKLAAPQRHAAIAGLNRELLRGAMAKSGKGEGDLLIANGLWGQPQKQFVPEFLRAGREFYGAELQSADFVGQADTERKAINAWASKSTSGRIPELLPPGSLDSTTRLVLVNAVYLKANWAYPFDPEFTKEAPFWISADKSIPVRMMHQRIRGPYVKVGGGEMVAVPYVNREMEMVLMLPKKGSSPDQFVQSFGLSKLDRIFPLRKVDTDNVPPAIVALAKREPRDTSYVDLSCPRFAVQSDGTMKQALESLGIRQIFDPKRADLSGLDAANDLCLADVFHAAKVEVTEEGTVAAAATGAGVQSRSAIEKVDLQLDRPFAFVIRHVRSGTILFVGRVNDPGSSPK